MIFWTAELGPDGGPELGLEAGPEVGFEVDPNICKVAEAPESRVPRAMSEQPPKLKGITARNPQSDMIRFKFMVIQFGSRKTLYYYSQLLTSVFQPLLFTILLVSSMASADAKDWHAELRLPKQGRVTGLKLSSNSVRVEGRFSREVPESFVVLEGHFQNPRWTLTQNQQQVPLSAKGEFHLKIPIYGKETMVEFSAIGPFGEVENESVSIYFSAWKEFVSGEHSKRGKVSFETGLQWISYQESRVPDLVGWTPVIGANYFYLLFPPRWDFNVGANFTPISLKDGANDLSIRFLGADLRLGYLLPGLRDPWSANLYFGAYYTTTFVSGGAFGFENMEGPQLYPTLRRRFEDGTVASAYFKFSPVTNGFSAPLGIENREVALGASCAFSLSSGSRLEVGIDYVSLNLVFPEQDITIHSDRAGIKVSLGI